MPRGDGTGPMGCGRMTGRGMGYCAGFDNPGYMNAGRPGGRMRARGFGFPRGLGGAWNMSEQTSIPDEELSFNKRVSVLETKMDEIANMLREIKESR